MAGTKVTKYVTGDTTRCVQAAFRMVMATLTGHDPGEARADALTGYVAGRGTWQFRMLLALANEHLRVIDQELFDFEGFTVDPVGAIKNQVQDDHVAQFILDETDIVAEVDAVKKCLASPFVQLLRRTPSIEDLFRQVTLGRLVMCNVNLQVLKGKREREGHVLIVERIDEDRVVAHDPGPDGGLALEFGRELFFKAWRSPSDAMANLNESAHIGRTFPRPSRARASH